MERGDDEDAQQEVTHCLVRSAHPLCSAAVNVFQISIDPFCGGTFAIVDLLGAVVADAVAALGLLGDLVLQARG